MQFVEVSAKLWWPCADKAVEAGAAAGDNVSIMRSAESWSHEDYTVHGYITQRQSAALQCDTDCNAGPRPDSATRGYQWCRNRVQNRHATTNRI